MSVQGLLYKDQLNPVAELDGAANVVAPYVYGDKPSVPAYMEKAGVTHRIISDYLGGVRLVINTASDAILKRPEYDAFGNIIDDTKPGL